MKKKGLLNLCCQLLGIGRTVNFVECMDQFIDEQRRLCCWMDGTVVMFGALRKNLEEFRPGLSLDDVDDELLLSFLDFLVVHDYNNTTISKKVSLLKWFLRWCVGKGLYKGNAHHTFSPRLKGGNYEDKEVVYLSEDELRLLENCPFENGSSSDVVRDLFLFACYSGLRFSDVQALRRQDVHDGALHALTKKTGMPVSIQLNKHTERIICKYDALEGDRLLPKMVSQVVNRRLKEIGKVAGIDTPVKVVRHCGSHTHVDYRPKYEVLSFHVARRTFVTLAVRLGIPSQVIMAWTGHRSERMLRPYLAVVDTVKEESMRKFDLV